MHSYLKRLDVINDTMKLHICITHIKNSIKDMCFIDLIHSDQDSYTGELQPSMALWSSATDELKTFNYPSRSQCSNIKDDPVLGTTIFRI